MNSSQDNIPDQFDYITPTDDETEFTVEIAEGISFSAQLPFFKKW